MFFHQFQLLSKVFPWAMTLCYYVLICSAIFRQGSQSDSHKVCGYGPWLLLQPLHSVNSDFGHMLLRVPVVWWWLWMTEKAGESFWNVPICSLIGKSKRLITSHPYTMKHELKKKEQNVLLMPYNRLDNSSETLTLLLLTLLYSVTFPMGYPCHFSFFLILLF